MARDYKHRANKDRTGGEEKRLAGKTNKRKPAVRGQAKKEENQTNVPLWRWGVVLGIICLFVYFLYSLSLTTEQEQPVVVTRPLSVNRPAPKQIAKPAVKKSAAMPKKVKPKQEIQYDFYAVLPEAEFVIPDYEVKTRKREERVGKVKTGVKYSVQAGAFRHYKDADGLKAKLLLMGFFPRIEKARIGSATWYRVKMGPYSRLVSVDAIQSKLKANNMDALVIEVKS